MKKKRLENLFVCSSVFHIFNVINLCGSEFGFKNSDILLIDFGTNIVEYIDLNFMRNIFNEVNVVKHKRRTKKRNVSFYFIVLKEILKNKLQSNKWNIEYENIFIAGTEIYSKIYSYRYMNPSTNLYYYEDGLASYISVLEKDFKRRQDTVFDFFYRKSPLELCKGIYLYETNNLIHNSYAKEVYSIPKIKDNTFVNKTIKKVFKNNVKEIRQKIIFLEAWFNELVKYRFQRELLENVISIVGDINVGIKKHPNSINDDKLYENDNVIDGISSFELNNMYYSLKDKILISIISTASLTPKMIYDEEPYVIFLYKIFLSKCECSEWGDIEEIIYKVQKSYREPSKIMIPESLSDLKLYLKGFLF